MEEEGGEGGSPAGFPGGQGPRWQVNQEPGTLERGVEGRGTLHTQGPEKCGLPHGPPRTECEMVREPSGPTGQKSWRARSLTFPPSGRMGAEVLPLRILPRLCLQRKTGH